MTTTIKISKPALEELEKIMGFNHEKCQIIIAEALKLLDAHKTESPD